MRGRSLLSATAFMTMLALAAPAISQEVRDHRTSSAPTVRDHRSDPPNVRDHRDGAAEGAGGVTLSSPRYMVTGVLIHCDDETGIDLAGSDDIRVVFEDAASRLTLETNEFADFDTGETQSFHAQQSCISPATAETSDINGAGIAAVWGCRAGGTGTPLRFIVTVIEKDHGFGPFLLCGPVNLAYACGGDQIGRETVVLDGARLSQALAHVGDTMLDVVVVGGYSITYRVQRLADAR